MARIKLTVPEKKIFTAEIPVRITDINYGNHVGNDSLVSIIHEARMQWLASAGYSELSIGRASLIMSDLAVEYKSESFYGDILTVQIAVAEIQKISFEVYYEVTAKRADKVLLIANVKTGMVCFDYATKKVAALPDAFAEFLNS